MAKKKAAVEKKAAKKPAKEKKPFTFTDNREDGLHPNPTWDIIDPIDYRFMGNTGVQICPLGLGGWITYGQSLNDLDLIKKIIFKAYDCGVNYFDNADMYASGKCEEIMGKAFKEIPRKHLVLASKCRCWIEWPMPNDRRLTRKHIFESIEGSLKRMGTDYLDVYYCHHDDPDTPMEETIRAMDDLVHQGKILYWGTSNFRPDQLREMHRLGDRFDLYKPKVEQSRYNLLDRTEIEGKLGPATRELGMGLITFTPLASGMLTGKYNDGIPKGSRFDNIQHFKDNVATEKNVTRCRKFVEYAKELGVKPGPLAIAWTIAQPNVTCAITGATKVSHIEESLESLKTEITEDIDKKLKEMFSIG